MSNLEREPAEVRVTPRLPTDVATDEAIQRGVELLEPRDVPLGGPRAMSVRRTLPQRARSLIGAWCFVDHYGPDVVAGPGANPDARGMVVPPHPHTGLQTVSWLFAGEVEHRDSAGNHAMVLPGELNLMTAGGGIQHSEVSTPTTTTLHGAQLWVALPDRDRHVAPRFEHYTPEPIEFEGATIRVFMGSLLGSTSPATTSPAMTYTALVGAQLDLPPRTMAALPVDARFEHGILLDAGDLRVDRTPIPRGYLAYTAPGRDILTLESGDEPVRALLLGGEPLGESIVMWWNFIGRSHDEIVAFRDQWQREVIARGDDEGRFGHIEGYDGSPLPAPELPNVRLRPRE